MDKIITLDDLREIGYNMFITYFKNNFEDGVCVWRVIEDLEKRKDHFNWIFWLFEKYKLTGIAKNWHRNGQLESVCQMQNGKGHGVGKKYDNEGNITEIVFYKENKEHGEYITFYKDGSIHEKYLMDDGQLLFGIVWYENGKISCDFDYRHAIRIKKLYDKYGKLTQETYFESKIEQLQPLLFTIHYDEKGKIKEIMKGERLETKSTEETE